MKKRTDDSTWAQHLRRWSTQAFAFIAATGAYVWLPDALAALTGNGPLWQPLVSESAYAVIMTVSAITGAVLRKLPQHGLD